MKRFQLSILSALLVLLALNSCVKKEFDAPPDTSKIDPALPVNMTIAKLKTKFVGPSASSIDSNWTIYGIVTADDRSGNFYKQINIEDSTGGITILIDAYSLYTHYPVGRKVYIKLKGLYYGFYSKLPQIGSTPDNTGALSNIPSGALDNYIVKATFPNEIKAQPFVGLASLKAVNNAMLNRLVRIENVEIVDGDLDKTYAQPAAISSGTSINLEDCNGNKIILRNSGYANFQNYKLPQGKGTITALYTVYGTTPQLVIRDTSDLQFYDIRCNGNPVPAPLITIDSLRKMYPGSGSFTISSAKITGIVISDMDNGNVSSGNFILEDDSHKGIILYVSGSSAYKLGDSLVIDVTGGKLSLYPTTGGAGSAMELTAASTSKITKAASGKSMSPVQLTIAALNASFAQYESVLVKIVSATISGGTTYSGSKTLSDGTGTISLYTASGAAFSGQTFPSGSHTVTGIGTPFTSGNEIKMRNPAIDVQ